MYYQRRLGKAATDCVLYGHHGVETLTTARSRLGWSQWFVAFWRTRHFPDSFLLPKQHHPLLLLSSFLYTHFYPLTPTHPPKPCKASRPAQQERNCHAPPLLHYSWIGGPHWNVPRTMIQQTKLTSLLDEVWQGGLIVCLQIDIF